MKTDTITPADLSSSVISVPPLALDGEGRASLEENRKMIDYLHQGGVRSFLYGGNANLYGVSVSEYDALLSVLTEIAPADSWMIPSFGPDFGKASDQAEILKNHSFPTAMLLPILAPVDAEGVATGIRRLAEKAGRPVIVYLKSETYLTVPLLGKLLADGVICSIKYAIDREDPGVDPYVEGMIDALGTSRLVSGFGERPVRAHLGDMDMQSYTSGSVCVAPKLSVEYLKLMKAKDFAAAEKVWGAFVPLEDLRDQYSPIRVLHEAVRLAGIAETGTLWPYLSNISDPEVLTATAAAAKTLRAIDDSFFGEA